VGGTLGMKAAVHPQEGRVDPGAGAVRIGAGGQHGLEIRVDADLEGVLPEGPLEPAGQLEAVQREHSAELGLDQEDFGRRGRVRHGEDPAGVEIQRRVSTGSRGHLASARSFSQDSSQWIV
jgi:hypothetical protein